MVNIQVSIPTQTDIRVILDPEVISQELIQVQAHRPVFIQAQRVNSQESIPDQDNLELEDNNQMEHIQTRDTIRVATVA